MSVGLTIAVALIGALGGAGLFGFIQYLIDRHDRKKGEADRLARLEAKIDKLEMHQLRSQLMTLIGSFPGETGDIMRVAEEYFHVKKGNWYMSDIFEEWINTRRINYPSWFEPREGQKHEHEHN